MAKAGLLLLIVSAAGFVPSIGQAFAVCDASKRVCASDATLLMQTRQARRQAVRQAPVQEAIAAEVLEKQIKDKQERKQDARKKLDSVVRELARERSAKEDAEHPLKIWNWRVWNDKLDAMDRTIRGLEEDAQRLENDIKTLEADISRLKSSGIKAAAELETEMTRLAVQVEVKKKDHIDKVTLHESEIEALKEQARAKEQIHEDRLAQLEASIKTAKSELTALQPGGTHDLKTQLETARASHLRVIAEYKESVANLTATIALTDLAYNEAQASKKSAGHAFDDTLEKFSAHKAKLLSSQEGARANMTAAENDLASTESASAATIAELSKKLEQQIEILGQAKTQQEGDRLAQIKTNEDAMREFRKGHDEVIIRMTAEISRLEAQRASAETSLQKLKGSSSGGEGSVSEALKNAVAELNSQVLTLQDEKKDTEEDLQRSRKKRAAKKAELDREDRWYNIWNWRIWSNKIQGIKDAIVRYDNEIKQFEQEAGTQQDEINRLELASESKHDAAQVAEDTEELIENLSGQVTNKEKQKANTAEAQGEEVKSLVAEEADEIQSLDASITNVTISTDQAQSEYDFIQSGAHSLQAELDKAKVAFNTIIAQHNETINNLAAAIALNDQDATRTRADKSNKLADFTASMSVISAQGLRLAEELKTTRADMEKAKEQKASAIQTGQAAIDARAKELRDVIQSQKGHHDNTAVILAKQRTANKEELQTKLETQSSTEQDMQSSVVQLERQQDETREDLAQLTELDFVD